MIKNHGLANLGATCYFNATMQVLMRTSAGIPVSLPDAPLKTSVPGGVGEAAPTASFPQEFNEFLQQYESTPGEGAVVVPNQFLQAVRSRAKAAGYPELAHPKQHDAHEQYLMWCDQHTFWQPRFQWVTRSVVHCKGCGHTSKTEEKSYCLEVDVVGDTMADCVNAWFSQADVPEFQCEGCKERGKVTKQNVLVKAPQVMVISLKRYHERGIRRRVQYPMRYVLNGSNYALKGVVYHYGGLHGGHYNAAAQSGFPGTWRMYDDGSVRVIEKEVDVVTPNAYLLVFEALEG